MMTDRSEAGESRPCECGHLRDSHYDEPDTTGCIVCIGPDACRRFVPSTGQPDPDRPAIRTDEGRHLFRTVAERLSPFGDNTWLVKSIARIEAEAAGSLSTSAHGGSLDPAVRARLEKFVQRVRAGWSARGAIGLEDDQFARDVNALLAVNTLGGSLSAGPLDADLLDAAFNDAVCNQHDAWIAGEPLRSMGHYLDEAIAFRLGSGATIPLSDRKHAAWCWLNADHEGLCEGDQ